MNGFYDDFDSLYELYDYDEPYLVRGDFEYTIEHDPTDEHPRLIRLHIVDLTKVPFGKPKYEYTIDEIEFENSIEFFHKYRFCNGKTLAEEMCDANGWDYSILSVFPKWYSPLFGDSEYPESEYRYIEDK